MLSSHGGGRSPPATARFWRPLRAVARRATRVSGTCSTDSSSRSSGRSFYAARLPWLYLVVLACGLALFATPLVREVARRWGVLDLPGERKVHATATPLFGGVAVYGAFAVTVLANFDFSRGLKGVAIGGTIVVVIGLLDDLTDHPAWLKFLGQIAAV